MSAGQNLSEWAGGFNHELRGANAAPDGLLAGPEDAAVALKVELGVPKNPVASAQPAGAATRRRLRQHSARFFASDRPSDNLRARGARRVQGRVKTSARNLRIDK